MDRKTGNTREALINAAGELFAARGLDGTSTRAIAAKAGVNIGGIHYHFGSKENLYSAAVTRVALLAFHPFDPDFLTEEALATSRGVSRAIAASIRARFATLYSAENPLWQGRLVARCMADSPAVLNDVIDQVFKPDSAVWISLFRLARPEMDDEDAMFLVDSIFANLIFYNQNRAAVLKHLGREEFGEGFFERAAAHTVAIVLARLGLPTEEEE
jgi:TetR/AcrR family transcriptional regulator, regulator of cefoperazone and chloramphenicol sensitivity